MALRTIRVQGDPVLEKICKPVKELTPRTKELIEDMLDTMYEANGVGLAAPQVGILKRIVVIDVGEGPVVMVNPVILETSGEQTGDEGCLSIPGKAGQVTRPNYVKVRALNEEMEEATKATPKDALSEFWSTIFPGGIQEIGQDFEPQQPAQSQNDWIETPFGRIRLISADSAEDLPDSLQALLSTILGTQEDEEVQPTTKRYS